ncbi:MAG: polysaccharide biosynthesis protein [Clostridia bacterium]|nr:polysaccharide biosynthesis protein [Clostridia bacterium]
MGNVKKQTFLQGALIIAIAHIFVKIIGALFKIPLTRFILGPDGIGIYNSSYTIYNVLFIVSTAGLPVAISKMVSESIAKKNYNEALKIFNVSRIILFVLGALGFCVLLFGATAFAEFLKIPSAGIAIMSMAPSLFFVSLMSSYRGFYQGMSNMMPTAISEVIESFGKMFVGLALAYIFLSYGVEYAASGAILGVSTGTFIAAAFLMLYWKKLQPDVKKMCTQDAKTSSSKSIASKLVKLAIPITLGASVFTLASVIDLTMIMRQLADLGFDEDARKTMYGYYSGYAVTMFNLPPTIIASLAVSIVPAISSALVNRDAVTATKTVETAIRITFLIALPCAIGMSVLSGPILNLAFGDTGAELLLAILAYGVIFVSVVMVANAIIQAKGNVWVPVINMCIGGIVKVVVNYILVGNINININGAPVGTVLCYLTTAVLDIVAINKYFTPKYGVSFFVKTIISAIIMGVCAKYLYSGLVSVTSSNNISLLVSVVCAVLIYFGLIIVFKAVERQDLEAMPFGEKLVKLLNNFL